MKCHPCAALIGIVLVLAAPNAYAGPCTEDIARFEKTIEATETGPGVGPGAPQSVGAQLEHQPTPRSVAQAERRARAGFEQALARAKHYDALQMGKKCRAALNRARLIYFQ